MDASVSTCAGPSGATLRIHRLCEQALGFRVLAFKECGSCELAERAKGFTILVALYAAMQIQRPV
jgi:hypothetical protein